MQPRLFTGFILSALLLLTACGEAEKERKAPAAARRRPAAPAQPRPPAPDSLRRFTWEQEACAYTGFYRPGQYTPRQLRNTLTLLSSSALVDVNDGFFAFRRDIGQLNPATLARLARKLTAQYGTQRKALTTLDIVPVPFWQQLKQLRLQELAESYELEKLNLAAYQNPGLLRQTPHLPQYSPECREYVAALTADDTTALLLGWRHLVEAQKKDNGAPEYLEQRYQAQVNSPQRLAYARVELMGFGWYNCANALRQYAALGEELPLEAELRKLFVRVSAECDEESYD